MNIPQEIYEMSSQGWKLFPCKPDKTPYTQHGFKDATDDIIHLEEWFNKYPDALIGIHCEGSVFLHWILTLTNKAARWHDTQPMVNTYGDGKALFTQVGPVQTSAEGSIPVQAQRA
jgi:hypothetical protein